MSRTYQPVYLATAKGTKNPEVRVALYNNLLAKYYEGTRYLSGCGGGPECSQYFRELLERSYPKIFSTLLSKVSRNAVTINALRRYLFPYASCHECGASTGEAGDAFCSTRCINLYRYGVANPMQSKKIRAKGVATNLRKRGVMYASQSQEVKDKKVATNLRRRGVDNPSKTQQVKDKKVATNLRRRGVDNPAKCAEVKARMEVTNAHRYGGHPMRNSRVRAKAKATNQRVRHVDYAMQCPEVRAKRVANCRKRLGVDHHFHIASIMEKAHRAAFRIKAYTYKGRVFEVQSSYEAFVFQKLVDLYGANEVLTQYDPGFPEYAFTEMRTHPDLYVKRLDLFVEVKSTWTLFGNEEHRYFEKNQSKARLADASGNKERWVLAYPDKNRYILLPRNWYAMSRSQVDTLTR